MSRVFFDLGNTRVKWWYEQDATTRHGQFAYTDMASALEPFAGFQEAVYASVVKDDRLNAFVRLAQTAGLKPMRCVVTAEALGVRCAYADVNRLGIDRWLAAVAAWHTAQAAVLVVDLGTAATFDFVDGVGQHLGGYILPGLRLGVSALLQGTSNVLVDFDKLGSDAGMTSPGINTTDAVYHGALFAMRSAVESAYQALLNQTSGAKLLITGGDAPLVTPTLTCDFQQIEELVFIGMRMLADAGQVVEEPAQE